MLAKKNAFYLLLILFLLDTGYSFVQHYQMPLDGDLGPITLPSEAYKRVMNDPLGLQVLIKNEVYPAPNRYFAHLVVSAYFKSMPFLLQNFVSPVKSVYLSCAFAKTLIQVMLILVLSCYISCLNLKKENIILCCVLLSPLFQAGHDNYKCLGVVDESVVYTFFYALPAGLFLLFLFPFYRSYITGIPPRFSVWKKIVWFALVIFLSLNGVLIPGVVLVSFSIILVSHFLSRYIEAKTLRGTLKNIDWAMILWFGFFMFSSMYSIYIGRNNLENFNAKLDVLERFSRIPSGLHEMFIATKGLTVLIAIVMGNLVLIRYLKLSRDLPGLKKLFLLSVLFVICYIVLLPFGGFRDYRPNILRNDTLLPVILIVFFMFGSTTLLLLKSKMKYYGAYFVFMIIVLVSYSILDTPLESRNWSERMAFKTIDESPLDCVPIKDSCTVFSWTLINDCAETYEEGKMLNYWGITKKGKMFYHDLDKTK